MFKFEPEIELSDRPYDAAIVFLAVMAYPEQGAGQVGAAGSEFAGSLISYLQWQARHHKGLAQFRREMNDSNCRSPHWAEFRGKMNRGLRRLRRRMACYALHGTRLLDGFFEVGAICAEAERQGRTKEVYHMAPNGKFGITKPEIWAQAIRSARATVSRDVGGWSARFGLNQTGSSASDQQKAKDLIRRAVRQSAPVLHMAHAFEEACRETGPTIGGWGERDPALALLMNSEKWIDQAIVTAEKWRLLSPNQLIADLNPDTMIHLTRKSLEKMPPDLGFIDEL